MLDVELVNYWLSKIAPLVEFLAGIFGLGSFALIAGLHWVLKRLRKQIGFWEGQVKLAQERMRRAKELAGATKTLAEERLARIGMLERKISELETVISSSGDGAKEMAVKLERELAVYRDKVEAALTATDYERATPSDDLNSFWSRTATRPEGYETAIERSIPILFFGNQKGGVGKTMTSVNLAAAFAERGENVLLVDLDYQGSASNIMVAQTRNGVAAVDARGSNIDLLFEHPLRPDWEKLSINRVTEQLSFVEAYYPFEILERSLEYRWNLKETPDDTRYRLARALLSPSIQGVYSRIILDAPPRFTLGFVNGICAATHVFVPTMVDSVSAEAVDFFARQFRRLRPAVNPALKICGVIGTVKTGNPLNTLPVALSAIARDIDDGLRNNLAITEALFMRDTVITHKAAITEAVESGIPYLIAPDVKPMYDKLANAVARLAPLRR